MINLSKAPRHPFIPRASLRAAVARSLADDLLDSSINEALDGDSDHWDDIDVRSSLRDARLPTDDATVEKWRACYRALFSDARSLYVERLLEGYCVYDERDDSRWWPNEGPALAIATHREPRREALAWCIASPEDGEWRS